MQTKTEKKNIRQLSLSELEEYFETLGQKKFRAKQVYEWLWQKHAHVFEDMTNLSKELRQQLTENFSLPALKVDATQYSADGTVKSRFRTTDNHAVEGVLIPTDERKTACVSSQIGCSLSCKFCATGYMARQRNLDFDEIYDEVVLINEQSEKVYQKKLTNIVFMGMGEPFLNYPNFIKAVRLLVEGVGFPESRMTVSTSGIIPRIHDFGAEPVRPKLAISLNASNDEVRGSIMPINKKWNLEMLMQAARDFPLRNRERITFEYVLLAGVNDSPAHAREVIELLRGIRCKVNLIALNPGPGIQFGTPAEQSVQTFKDLLAKAGIPAFVRRPRGRDIYAACGQLKRTVA